MPDPVDLSLVIPVYNERDNLAPLIGEIERALAGRRFEIVAVNDGSTDGSLEALKELKRAQPALHIVSFAANAGQTAAFAAGFQAARAPVIVTLDADGQNDPADIPGLVDALAASGATAVAGYRVDRHDIQSALPVDASLDDQLSYCSEHQLRIHAKWGSYAVDAQGQAAPMREDVVDRKSVV